jgi:hypothetical protein
LLAKTGVTPYSTAYWDQWYGAKGRMNPWLPINETLAEIANVSHAKPGENGMPADYPEKMKAAKPIYQGLFKAFNDAYEIVKARKQ